MFLFCLDSFKEGVSAGVPFLTFPIAIDQGMSDKAIGEDWMIGWRVKSTEAKIDHLVTSEEIAGLVKTFMDLEDGEGKEMRRRTREFQQIFHAAIAEGGSSSAPSLVTVFKAMSIKQTTFLGEYDESV